MLRAIILLVLVFLVACQTPVTQKPVKVPLITPVVIIKAPLPMCPVEQNAVNFIDNMLSSNESCQPLLKNKPDVGELTVMCDDAECAAVTYSPALAAVSGKASVSQADVAGVQKQALDFSQQTSLMSLNSLSGLDALVRSGLYMWDRLGVNPYQKGLLASPQQGSLYTGVLVSDAQALHTALQQGNTFLTHNKGMQLKLQAGFSKSCELNTWQGSVLPVAPYDYEGLWFSAKISLVEQNSYLVKYWLDLKGNLHKKNMPIQTSETCKLVKDNTFDPAHSSVYYLKVGDIAVSSPIWYLPIQG